LVYWNSSFWAGTEPDEYITTYDVNCCWFRMGKRGEGARELVRPPQGELTDRLAGTMPLFKLRFYVREEWANKSTFLVVSSPEVSLKSFEIRDLEIPSH